MEHEHSEERQGRLVDEAVASLGLQLTLWGQFWIHSYEELERICIENPDDASAIEEIVEFLRADGAEDERWYGPDPNQFYWDASRRCAVTSGNRVGGAGKLDRFFPEAEGVALYLDVGIVEDAGVTWHGLWLRTFSWEGWLKHRRLTISIDGEPVELELRSELGSIEDSTRYQTTVYEERSIFNSSAEILRKVARARTVTARLAGQDQVIEKEFNRRNIARVRKFVRDYLAGDSLR